MPAWRRAAGALWLPVLLLAGCGDAATRLASDVESGASGLGRGEGERASVEHRVPSQSGQCVGPYTVQFDQVGAIVVWCKDAAGEKVVSSHITTHHSDVVSTASTIIVDKPAGEPLWIDLERRGRQVWIVGAR